MNVGVAYMMDHVFHLSLKSWPDLSGKKNRGV